MNADDGSSFFKKLLLVNVAYKCFTRQNIAEVPLITELERVLYKQKNPYLCENTVKFIYFDYVHLYWLSDHIANY